MQKKHQSLKYFKFLYELASKTENAEDKSKFCLNMHKIIYKTRQKVKISILFRRNFDISLEFDNFNIVENSIISFGVSLVNYRMSQYEDFIKFF
jgi:hypothetical protein